MFGFFLKLVELRGIQASGKTTLAKSWLQRYENLGRVNRDDLRNMLFSGSYKRHQEPIVVACEQACAKALLEYDYNVVVDDTNLSVGNMWKDLADLAGVEYSSYLLQTSVDEAIKRDAARPNPVGAAAIRATAKKL